MAMIKDGQISQAKDIFTQIWNKTRRSIDRIQKDGGRYSRKPGRIIKIL